MSGRILAIHYTPPGVIGGVEHILHQHIGLLERKDFRISVVAGRTSEDWPDVTVIPEIDAAAPASAAVEEELAAGVVSARFHALKAAIRQQLAPMAEDADFLLVHNAFTLHFSLPLTAVLWELAAFRTPGTAIAWSHDLAWVNPLYRPALHDGYPWDLLRFPAPNTTYITVSEERKNELLGLWNGQHGHRAAVVPNGVEPAEFLRLSAPVRDVVDRYALFDRDAVLLLPVRITRRKNIEAGIRAVAELRRRGLDVRFLISGPEAPHHPGRSRRYLATLLELRQQLDVEDEVVFLAHDLGSNLDDRSVAELYSVADVLLFPSASEGFGLPILEAGLARLPSVVSDIAVFNEVGDGDVLTFDLQASADGIAETVIEAIDSRPSRLYRRVLREYRWDVILERHILPLLAPRTTQEDQLAV